MLPFKKRGNLLSTPNFVRVNKFIFKKNKKNKKKGFLVNIENKKKCETKFSSKIFSNINFKKKEKKKE